MSCAAGVRMQTPPEFERLGATEPSRGMAPDALSTLPTKLVTILDELRHQQHVTHAELCVLEDSVCGLSPRAAARRRGIELNTWLTHKRNLLRKCGAGSLNGVRDLVARRFFDVEALED
jgi:DNA-binding NarL/FixJ family response regulator